jgi:flagellar assembly factor FliW
MRFADNIDSEVVPVGCASLVRMPVGLLGFERIKEYQLVTNPDEAPFCWLQASSEPSLAFLVINPFLTLAEYQPDIPDEDARLLGLRQADEALLFNIVTVRGANRATVNLKGPVVINRRTYEGKQVVLNNAAQYSVAHPLPLSH